MSAVSRTPDGAEEQQPFSPLVGQLVTTLFAKTTATASALIDLQKSQIADLTAELYAIRHGVDRLLAGPWMPTPDAIREAVFIPSQKLIEEYKTRKEVDW